MPPLHKNNPRVQMFVKAYTDPKSPYFAKLIPAYSLVMTPDLKKKKEMGHERYEELSGRYSKKFVNNTVVQQEIKKSLKKHMKHLNITFSPQDIYDAWSEYLDIDQMEKRGIPLVEAYKLKGNAVKELCSYRLALLKLQLSHGYGLEDDEVKDLSEEELAKRTLEAFKAMSTENLQLEEGETETLKQLQEKNKTLDKEES
jgi:hypothetical protein